MLAGAFASVVFASWTGSMFVGVLFGSLSGVLLALLHAVLAIRFRVDQVISGTGIVILIGQLVLLRNVDVLAIAQSPSFASNGLSILYLLCSHVFEHFLDFVLIVPLTGGIYALVRFLAL